ncbi:LacI family DNA-binding transcriptional regulator [Paenibacillus methanolicus]|uniref:LacI family transcriptional regulator n=1 Tax=Paenibacillus methanolicus TaxID=582686 RepID=A0A5S5CLK5_9BACL|nr:LacI family DNA-binding transcriptional regulator [Paenibacillus methanolicus]TYP79737.1 LacI family transcriptional regulator [Paenibacillus methanolicus]
MAKISMQTIADHLGLSKYSVSQALSGKPGVSEETRQRVWAAAKTLGYRLGKSDSELAAAATPASYILIWIDERQAQDPAYWGRVLSGISAGASALGWHYVMTSGSGGNSGRPSFPHYLDEGLCLGHLIVGRMPTASVASIYQMGQPVVLIDHRDPLIEADSVFNDNAESGARLVRHLAQAGRRSLLFVGDDSFAVSFRDRWTGCRQAVEELGGRTSGCVLRKLTIRYKETGWQDNLGRKAEQLLAEHDIDAIVCANDHIALELIQLLKKRGVDIPGRCAVAGFDNIEQAAYFDPPLTTIELAKEVLGYRGVEQLARRRENPGALAERIALSSRLVVRQSG